MLQHLEADHDIHALVRQRDTIGGPVKDLDVRNVGEALPGRLEDVRVDLDASERANAKTVRVAENRPIVAADVEQGTRRPRQVP